MNDSLDLTVLGAITSYKPDKPATRRDLWSMVLVRRGCLWHEELDKSLQRLKKSGVIKYSRKPAGWVAVITGMEAQP